MEDIETNGSLQKNKHNIGTTFMLVTIKTIPGPQNPTEVICRVVN